MWKVLHVVGHTDGDALSRLSPVLEQLDILEIQQTAIRQLTTKQENASIAAIATEPATTTATPTAADADESDTKLSRMNLQIQLLNYLQTLTTKRQR